MPRLQLRLYLDSHSWIGPGKVQLLELIASEGSIAAAGRRMDMSYKRAWDLIAELNRIFGAPVVSAQTGGRRGGGAALTGLGQAIIDRYRSMEAETASAAARHVAALEALRPMSPAPLAEGGGR